MDHVHGVHSFTVMELRPLACMVGGTERHVYRAERLLCQYNPVQGHGLSIINYYNPNEPYRIHRKHSSCFLISHQWYCKGTTAQIHGRIYWKQR
jgi:hypothetical protein